MLTSLATLSVNVTENWEFLKSMVHVKVYQTNKVMLKIIFGICIRCQQIDVLKVK